MDVFAVGVLLHQALTGALPGAPGATLPSGLGAIVERALAPDPRDRWASAAELGAALAAAAPVAPAVGPPALAPEEQSWQRAVALALAGATAVALYAVLVSLTPRTLDAGDALPFVAFGTEPRPGGRVFTRARFETWPTLAAAGAFALAFAAYGLLRRHWRRAGLDLPAPDRALGAGKPLLALALVLDALFVVRWALQESAARALATYIPVLGGVLELTMVYQLWFAVLEAQRTSRPLRRERLMWVAVALSLVPPVISFARILAGLSP
jgi:serine/threonine-protein kinase